MRGKIKVICNSRKFKKKKAICERPSYGLSNHFSIKCRKWIEVDSSVTSNHIRDTLDGH